MVEKLDSLGFAVNDTLHMDRTHHEMLTDIEKFAECIHECVTDIMFYYAGHGCSISKYIETRVNMMERLILSPIYPCKF